MDKEESKKVVKQLRELSYDWDFSINKENNLNKFKFSILWSFTDKKVISIINTQINKILS